LVVLEDADDEQTFDDPKTPEEWTHNAKVANARLDRLTKKWNACKHIFGVLSEPFEFNGQKVEVQCVRCGYGCIMPAEKTTGFAEFWDAWGKYTAQPEFAMGARRIVEDMDRKEAQP
jgi:hypothetical protein